MQTCIYMYLVSNLFMVTSQYVPETCWSVCHRSILWFHPEFTGRVTSDSTRGGNHGSWVSVQGEDNILQEHGEVLSGGRLGDGQLGSECHNTTLSSCDVETFFQPMPS